MLRHSWTFAYDTEIRISFRCCRMRWDRSDRVSGPVREAVREADWGMG